MNSVNKKLMNIYKLTKEDAMDFCKKCENTFENSEKFIIQYCYCPDNYIESKTKIMFVGQDPNGWGYATEILDAMKFTQDALKKIDWHAPYWRFIHELESIINGEKELSRDYIFWSNIFHIIGEVDPHLMLRNSDLTMEYLDHFQTLSAEIAAADPNILIFLTGPNYDLYIERIFKDIQFLPVSQTFDVRELARLTHRNLPNNTFRLYHPGYANRYRDRLWEPVMQEVKAHLHM